MKETAEISKPDILKREKNYGEYHKSTASADCSGGYGGSVRCADRMDYQKKFEKEEFREASAERKADFSADLYCFLRLQPACGCIAHILVEDKV